VKNHDFLPFLIYAKMMKNDDNNKETVFPSGLFFLILCAAFIVPFIITKITHSEHALETPSVDNTAKDADLPKFNPKGFVDLGNYYNAGLATNWLGGEIQDRSLVDLPTNVNVFNGATFRVEGIIQLQGVTLKKRAPWYPDSVKGIPVQMTCSNLHFLHGVAWSVAERLQIGSYIIHFADASQVEFPIRYGIDVRNWSFNDKDPYQTAKTAWSSKKYPIFFRLYAANWENPKPDIKVTSIDFISSGTDCAPFLLAVTAE
jgi:hypothetical protein